MSCEQCFNLIDNENKFTNIKFYRSRGEPVMSLRVETCNEKAMPFNNR